jgi:hypothetical protein
MISTEPYYYAGYAIAILVYVIYGASLYLRRRSVWTRRGHR